MCPNHLATIPLFDDGINCFCISHYFLQLFAFKNTIFFLRIHQKIARNDDNAVAHATVQLTSSLIHSPIHHSSAKCEERETRKKIYTEWLEFLMNCNLHLAREREKNLCPAHTHTMHTHHHYISILRSERNFCTAVFYTQLNFSAKKYHSEMCAMRFYFIHFEIELKIMLSEIDWHELWRNFSTFNELLLNLSWTFCRCWELCGILDHARAWKLKILKNIH